LHPHDKTLRDAYATFAKGDLDGYLAYCTDDITFTIPGKNRLTGTYTRETFGSGLIAKVMQMTNGTFTETVLDVFVSDRGGIVYAHHAFEARGRHREYRTLHLYDIRDGKLASFREIPLEMETFEQMGATRSL
jgi:ketosteroid isomerase-like protein